MVGEPLDAPGVAVDGQPVFPQGQSPHEYPQVYAPGYHQPPVYHPAAHQPPVYHPAAHQPPVYHPAAHQPPVYHPAAQYIGQPPMNVQGPPMPNAGPSQWTSSLCGCCNDCFSCCLVCWMPCVAFGQIAQKVDDDQSSCFVNGLIYAVACAVSVPCRYSSKYRHKMRARFQLPEAPCNDCCTHFCCEPCALCQEYRELQNRGIDPALS